MSEFLDALFRHAFLQHALAAGLLASVACGVVGSYVAARRITYIAGGIAHCVLGGMGAARYAEVVWGLGWVHPLHGAVLAALAAALIIGFVSLRLRESEDTVISALWAVGMAGGVLLIARTPGYHEDLMSYLFGNILMVSREDLVLIGALDAAVILVGLGCYKQLTAVCLDEEFARVRGVHVERYYLLLLCLTALTVVLLVTVVGLIMVIALLSLPVAIAAVVARSLWQVMLLAALVSGLLTSVGLAVSYPADLPAGAVSILLVGAAYLFVSLGGAGLRRRRASLASTKQE